MRKKSYIIILVLFNSIVATQVIAQDFLGLSTGNYAGITGVMLQPASIVDSRFKFDINLFSTSFNYSNNYLLVSRDAILKFNKNNFGDYATFKQNYLSQASLNTNEKVYFNINNRTQIPLSFMATTGKKSAIALNIQSRSMIQGRDIPQGLASVAYNNFFPTSNSGIVDASGFNLLSLNWVEVGLTYGRVLYSNEKHFLKAAFTGKYLGGVSNLAMGSNDFRIGVNADSTFNFNTSGTQYNHNANADFNNIFDKNFSPDASSFGFDAGIVYEFRGNIAKYKYLSGNEDKSYEKERRDVNKYMFKIGVSLLDAGKFSFNKPDNVNNFAANINRWDIRNEHFSNISQFDTALAHRSTGLPNDPRNYNVYLPTALSIQIDLRFYRGFYLNVMSYTPVTLGSGSNNAGYHFNNYDYYTVTPRWESRNIGIYIPYTFGNHQQLDNYKDNLLGATVRLGPLFIGSSNLGTMAFNKNLKAADVHVGLKIGFTYGKPNKASMFLDKMTTKRNKETENDTLYTVTNKNVNKNKRDTLYANNLQKKPTQLIVDYKNGQIYTDGSQGGNVVIINNNNFYSNNSTGYQTDSNAYKNNMAQMNYLNYQMNDSMMKTNYKYDSTQRILNDSLNRKKARLDSLIRNMQNLRKGMDNSNNRNYNDTLITPSKTSLNKTKDSSSTTTIKLNGNNKSKVTERIKKDTTITGNKIAANTLITKDKVYNNPNDPSQSNNQQNQYLPNQREGIVTYGTNPQDVTYERDSRQQQDQDYNRYIDQSNQLQREIQDLQTQIGRQQGRNTNRYSSNYYPNNYYPNNNTRSYPTVVPIPVPITNNKKDIVYVRDTIYIRDTTHRYDTMMLTKNIYKRDTLLKNIPSPSLALNNTNESFNYNTNQPSEFILFGLGRSAIQPIYNDRLNYISGILKNEPNLYGLITGHTDATGSQKVNEALSLKRANKVKTFLIDKGVKPEQLIVTPQAANAANKYENGKDNNLENRRTDIKISDKKPS